MDTPEPSYPLLGKSCRNKQQQKRKQKLKSKNNCHFFSWQDFKMDNVDIFCLDYGNAQELYGIVLRICYAKYFTFI